MANQDVSTTQEGMRNAASQFEGQANAFKTKLQAIGGSADSLSAAWTGQASQVFHNAMQSWQQSFQRVISELDGLSVKMTTAAGGFSSAEDDAVQQANDFSNAAQGLPI